MQRKQFTFYRSFYESIQNLKTNKEKLLAYDMIYNLANLKAYMAIPTISDTYMDISQIFDDLKFLPLPVTNSFWEPLPFTRYPFFSRATSASSFAIRSCI